MQRRKINLSDWDGNIIGTKYRDEIDYKKDIYQVSGLWITNSQGEILIAQRNANKDKDPGMWGPAVEGTVDEGETFEVNIYKEAAEEIGLVDVEFTLGPRQILKEPRQCVRQWYFAQLDKSLEDFTLQKEEVENLAWISQESLLNDMKTNSDKYVPALHKIIDTLISFK